MANQQQSNPSDGGQQGQQPQFQQDLQPKWVRLLWFAVLLMAVLYVTQTLFNPQVNTIPYSQFKNKVRQGEVAEVTMQGHQITGRYKSGGGEAADNRRRGPGKAMPFETIAPSMQDPELIDLLENKDVTIHAKSTKQSWFVNLLIAILPWVVIIGAFFYFSKKFQDRMGGGPGGGIFGFGKSKAKQFEKSMSDIQFEDVAGLENTKKELQEIIGFLKNPDQYRSLGGKLPKGVLLVGPPGTGKTLMARAVAGEADVPFFSISGSEFIEMFVGVGASRVRDMFDNAKKESPAIIFIDEIDSIGRVRGTGVGGGHDEREQTLNQILNEMDGFEPHEAVVVLAATNRPDVLDQALLRPGRFDRKVTLDLPDRRARKSILEIHTAEMPLADDVDLERLAALTVTFSGADIENLVNEAALLAGREKREEIDMQSLLAARDKVVLGGKREMLIEDEEKALIACHEAGHAVAATFLPHADPLDKVTIIPRGRALGATEQIPDEERHNLPEDYLRDRIGVMLGGRVAEQLVYGQVTSGSAQDLKQATGLARRMVSQWGMSEKLGAAAFSRGEEHVFLGKEMAQERNFSEHTARIIDDEICSLVSAIEESVQAIMQDKRERLEALTCALVDDETLEAEAVEEILRG